MTATAPYRRVLLKLSGESFARTGERGISMEEVLHIARQTVQAAARGVQLAVVIGGGNILRGASFTAGNTGVQEATAHYMGMLATVINGLALQDAIESLGITTRLMTAIQMDGVAEPYIRRRARHHLEKGRIVILAAGTGSPFVTTDTAAAQRALELEADILMKATRVDGVYSDDPEKNPHAVLYRDLTYQQIREQNLRVMDATAISQCMEHAMPILVFNYRKDGNIERAVAGEKLGTLVGCRRGGRGILGVIAIPALAELAYATDGGGAWHVRGGEAAVAAGVSRQDTLAESLVCSSDFVDFARWSGGVEAGRLARTRLDEAAGLMRTWGDGYGYLLVATGRAEVMIDPRLHPWDAAAVEVVVREAGGRFGDWRGGGGIDSGDGLATNGLVHDQVLALLQG